MSYGLNKQVTVGQAKALGTRVATALGQAGGGGAAAAAVTFADSGWTAPAEEGGDYTLSIPQASHGRSGDGYLFNLYQLVDGVYVNNTWGTAGTRVSYRAGDGAIVLSAPEGYSGKLVVA